jgi:hypothetical protein
MPADRTRSGIHTRGHMSTEWLEDEGTDGEGTG